MTDRVVNGPPRAGGGQPVLRTMVEWVTRSSPRRRGSAGVAPRRRDDGLVLPAQAGVSRTSPSPACCASGPPRAGGGQPAPHLRRGQGIASSPRRRGSAAIGGGRRECSRVLPAQAGVSRRCQRRIRRPGCPPRAGGGQPPQPNRPTSSGGSSPRRRGSAVPDDAGAPACGVLPAQAGVSRPAASPTSSRRGPPRAGGGQPLRPMLDALEPLSSPRRRGSAVSRCRVEPQDEVLPAQAGVSRSRRRRSGTCPPRAGGGQPSSTQSWALVCWSSPRRRGSAERRQRCDGRRQVLPAQAGVSRPISHSPNRAVSPPRAGGGQPAAKRAEKERERSSPRRRGSAGNTNDDGGAEGVLPAQAGVSRPPGGRSRGDDGPPRAGGGQPTL